MNLYFLTIYNSKADHSDKNTITDMRNATNMF